MPNNWVLLSEITKKEKDASENNYQLLTEDSIRCAGCNKPLVNIIKVKETSTTNVLKAFCPYCNDTSFVYKIDGKIYLQAVDGLTISDIDTNIQNNIISQEIHMVTNEKR